MASSLALKKLLASSVLSKSLNPVRTSAAFTQSATRLFNTNAARDYDSDDDDRRSVRDAQNRRDFPFSPFSDVFEPFTATRSVSQLLNMMDGVVDAPAYSALSGFAAVPQRGSFAKVTPDGLYLRVDMPGLGKEDVKVLVENSTLIIKGEGKKEAEDSDEDGERRYTSRLHLPEKMYKTSDIKAEMKNGVLKVMVPMVKEEERTSVFNVKIE